MGSGGYRYLWCQVLDSQPNPASVGVQLQRFRLGLVPAQAGAVGSWEDAVCTAGLISVGRTWWWCLNPVGAGAPIAGAEGESVGGEPSREEAGWDGIRDG